MAQVFCLTHPGREAAARCTSCGQSFCRECITRLDGRMVCGSCYRQKTRVEVNAARDWYVPSILFQVVLGLGILWLSAWMLGKVLLDISSDFHEGNMWDRVGRPTSR